MVSSGVWVLTTGSMASAFRSGSVTLPTRGAPMRLGPGMPGGVKVAIRPG